MTMHCESAREALLATFDDAPASVGSELAAHLAGCEACSQFAARHEALHRRLTAAVTSPAMDPRFRQRLRARTDRLERSSRFDFLPDVVHFSTCAAAVVVCLAVLPADRDLILVAGTTTALLTYAILTVARGALEDAVR